MPGLESRILYAGHRLAGKQVSARLLLELGGNPGFDVVNLEKRLFDRRS